MKKIITIALSLSLIFFLGCGQSEQERKIEQQHHDDSLKQVLTKQYDDSLNHIALQKAHDDSIRHAAIHEQKSKDDLIKSIQDGRMEIIEMNAELKKDNAALDETKSFHLGRTYSERDNDIEKAKTRILDTKLRIAAVQYAITNDSTMLSNINNK
jgi:hypothetical protein